ncbi:hypothetical protein KBD45_00370 [Candidatus Dojkabacteria bacterium]|nr:hypothetical protein [Candidatus Dojkabacteria bacterium]
MTNEGDNFGMEPTQKEQVKPDSIRAAEIAHGLADTICGEFPDAFNVLVQNGSNNCLGGQLPLLELTQTLRIAQVARATHLATLKEVLSQDTFTGLIEMELAKGAISIDAFKTLNTPVKSANGIGFGSPTTSISNQS